MKIRTRWATLAVGAAVVLAGAAYVNLDDRPKGDHTVAELPTQATATYPEGASSRSFASVASMVATADYVVMGSVSQVEVGEPIVPGDGTRTEIVPRTLVVDVRAVLFSRDRDAPRPTTLRISDGYWADGVGYERETLGWAMPGQVGYFLVGRDRAPDGRWLETYTPLDGSGVGLVDGAHVRLPDNEVWRGLGTRPAIIDFRRTLHAGIAEAKSGAARPVPTTFCYPSEPDDENSEPICEEY